VLLLSQVRLKHAFQSESRLQLTLLEQLFKDDLNTFMSDQLEHLSRCV